MSGGMKLSQHPHYSQLFGPVGMFFYFSCVSLTFAGEATFRYCIELADPWEYLQCAVGIGRYLRES